MNGLVNLSFTAENNWVISYNKVIHISITMNKIINFLIF